MFHFLRLLQRVTRVHKLTKQNMLSSTFNMNKLKLNHQIFTQNRANLLYSILIFFNHFAYGITVNMVGATLVDLRFIYDVSLNVASYMPMAYGVGYLIGSLASYLYKYLNRQLLLTLFIGLMSLTITFLPHYGPDHFHLAILSLICTGIGAGAWDSAVIIWLVDMWPVGNGPLIQASQFMYGLGSIAAPTIVAPFVYGEVPVVKGINNETTILTVENRVESLSFPFTVVGTIQALGALGMALLYCTNRYEKKSYVRLKNDEEGLVEDADDSIIPRSFQQSNLSKFSQPNRNFKLLLCGLCLSCYATARIGYFTFSPALLQHLDIHLSASSSAHLLSILSITYTSGRLVNAFVSIKLPPESIISYHYAMLLSAISLLYLKRDDLWCISFGTALLGYGFSAIWPTVFAFTERHLGLSDSVCSLYSFLSGFVSLTIPLILGQSFNANPLILFWLEAIFISLSCGFFMIVKFSIQKDGAAGGKHSHVY